MIRQWIDFPALITERTVDGLVKYCNDASNDAKSAANSIAKAAVRWLRLRLVHLAKLIDVINLIWFLQIGLYRDNVLAAVSIYTSPRWDNYAACVCHFFLLTLVSHGKHTKNYTYRVHKMLTI